MAWRGTAGCCAPRYAHLGNALKVVHQVLQLVGDQVALPHGPAGSESGHGAALDWVSRLWAGGWRQAHLRRPGGHSAAAALRTHRQDVQQ